VHVLTQVVAWHVLNMCSGEQPAVWCTPRLHSSACQRACLQQLLFLLSSGCAAILIQA
jgi:hypothetical protein